MARRLLNFIDSFCEFALTYSTTRNYAKAGAMWMVGTAVTRQVAMKARANLTYPNMFFQLIGGPGTGKSQLINAVRRVLIPATKMSLIPASITRAGLEDYMQENLQSRKSPDGSPLFSNECIGLSEEMQGILPEHDISHLTLYNLLYDCPTIHKAVTRTNGEVKLESPYCSILTGAQPAFLATMLPEQAWGMGFMSRSILVFSAAAPRRSAFEFREVDMKLLADLIHDMGQIHKLVGYMEWSKGAKDMYDEWWVRHGGIPIPSAKRLAMGYNSRRELHFFKLAMIHSLARSDSLVVELEDAAAAVETLLHFESQMSHIFTEMSQTGSMIAIQDVLDSVKVKAAEDKDMDEADLINILMQRFPSTQVHATIENLLNSNAIQISKNTVVNARGFRKFTIGSRAGGLQ